MAYSKGGIERGISVRESCIFFTFEEIFKSGLFFFTSHFAPDLRFPSSRRLVTQPSWKHELLNSKGFFFAEEVGRKGGNHSSACSCSLGKIHHCPLHLLLECLNTSHCLMHTTPSPGKLQLGKLRHTETRRLSIQ